MDFGFLNKRSWSCVHKFTLSYSFSTLANVIHLKKNKLTPHNRKTPTHKPDNSRNQKAMSLKQPKSFWCRHFFWIDCWSACAAELPIWSRCRELQSCWCLEQKSQEWLRGLRLFSLEKGDLITLQLHERMLEQGVGPFSQVTRGNSFRLH